MRPPTSWNQRPSSNVLLALAQPTKTKKLCYFRYNTAIVSHTLVPAWNKTLSCCSDLTWLWTKTESMPSLQLLCQISRAISGCVVGVQDGFVTSAQHEMSKSQMPMCSWKIKRVAPLVWASGNSSRQLKDAQLLYSEVCGAKEDILYPANFQITHRGQSYCAYSYHMKHLH